MRLALGPLRSAFARTLSVSPPQLLASAARAPRRAMSGAVARVGALAGGASVLAAARASLLAASTRAAFHTRAAAHAPTMPAPPTSLLFNAAEKPAPRVIVAKKDDLAAAVAAAAPSVPATAVAAVVDGHVDAIPVVAAAGAAPEIAVLGTYSDERSRHNAVIRADSVAEAVSKLLPKKKSAHVTIAIDAPEQALPVAVALARQFPLFSRKTDAAASKDKDADNTPKTVVVDFLLKGRTLAESASQIAYDRLNTLATATRLAARLVDTPTNELNVTTYVAEVEKVAAALPHTTLKVIRGTDLRDQGFGGLWNVGKASEHLPALAVLSYKPPTAVEGKCMAWVGKGIVYDTGGLNIKTGTNMPGMKVDMGGSAAVLGAFQAAVLQNYPYELHALLCLAENSVSKESQRPDDIIKFYSGKTAEINNTDAEGRLVLADGVAYATKHLRPSILVDIATLTGAQAFATGFKHAGVLSNSATLESLFVSLGKLSGDIVHPLLYAPEYQGIAAEFASQVADMKNSVKNRANASSSAAGLFVESHICDDGFKVEKPDQEPKKLWGHLDIAYPAVNKERGTGFGVALLAELAVHSAKSWPVQN